MQTPEQKNDLTIDASALAGLLEAGEPVTVLDVRPVGEREEWYIPGSLHVDAYDALERHDPDALAGVDLLEDRPIVTVCGAGKTSLTAAEQLRSRGMQALSLAGGMKAWSLAFNTADVSLAGTAAEVVQVRRTGKGCLSYLVGAGGAAAVIDAALPPAVYVHLAEARGWRITHVLDTHIHADHLSRSRLLAEETGTTLHLPEQQRVSFPFEPVRDGDVRRIGGARLRALRTPGHTDDSTCYLLDAAALFTGDTLFTDGVGRPDLKASREEARTRAEALYDSLQRLLREVPAGAVVLPGHTSRPAVFDGRAIADTLAGVRGRVEALSRAKDAFVRHLLERIPPTPPSYERIVALNEAGAPVPAGILDLEAGANRCAIS
jgi:glyoxylase-like metal-dependent hydrolase (beta-lactamase superfamily II)